MGLDGFSMGNLGLNTDLTPAQVANQVETLAQKEFEFKIKDVSQLAQDQGIKRKEGNSENHNFKDGFKKKKNTQEDANEDDLSAESANEIDFEAQDPKDFSVRVNPETEMIELFSNIDDKILETISAKDLMNLIAKLNSASGILVNRKI